MKYSLTVEIEPREEGDYLARRLTENQKSKICNLKS